MKHRLITTYYREFKDVDSALSVKFRKCTRRVTFVGRDPLFVW